MNRLFSFDPKIVTRLADNAEQLAREGHRAVVAAKAIVVEAREIYYLVSPLLERFKLK
jgi:hypothetical protein